jgi:hypothetical protein
MSDTTGEDADAEEQNEATARVDALMRLIETEPTQLGRDVCELWHSCLFRDEEMVGGQPLPSLTPVMAEGIAMNVGFHPERIAAAKERVRELLRAIASDEFLTDKGGGYSFLSLCVDRQGNQWTNLHRTQEKLVQLAIATGLGAYCVPRALWAVMPGGVPYVQFTL